ncbi:MAG: PIG-L family deacetylase [Chloroflexi bacterium]|nr:PIG-L family deacetylase [Chloroflexota bacterium]
MKTLVAIFAHPDDESFGIGGTLAKYAHEGISTHYVCATRGESGTVDPEMMQGYTSVAELRSTELECASRELGLAGVHYLDYRDSGMLGSEDNRHENSLFAAATDEVAQRIIRCIERLKPDVIITHDQFGGYGHPDHIKLNQATLRAYEMLYDIQLVTKEDEPTLTQPSIAIADGHAAISPAQTAIPRLYVTAFSRRFLRLAVRLLPLVGQDPRKFGRNKDIDLVQITSWFVPITAQLNVKPYIPHKERASACHLSQRPPTQQGSFITRLAFRRAQHLETFSRLYPPLKRSERMETDLFGA